MSLKTESPLNRHSSIRREGVHALRLFGLLFIIILIHLKARSIEQLNAGNTRLELAIELVHPYFPTPVHWGKNLSSKPLKREILNQEDKVLGSAFETSPLGDQSIGFSGPTNMLVVCDIDDKIIAAKILHSRDTPEHVAIVNTDPAFLSHLTKRTLSDVVSQKEYDGVSGATLTSLAIVDAIKLNAGAEQGISSRFKQELNLVKIQEILPAANELKSNSSISSLVSILDIQQKNIGWILRTTPAADLITGYQGPTDTWMVFNERRIIVGLIVAETYDNEPYIDYVRTEASFSALFEGKSLEELASMTLDSSGYEGVSGATMTSQAITASIFHAAARYLEQQREANKPKPSLIEFNIKDYLLLGLIAFTIILSMSKLRGNSFIRISLRLVIIVYLGFIYGGLLSQAMWIGWIKYGIPFKHAFGLFVLTIIAVVFPLATRQNIYCNHLCPHGALQQLIKPKTSKLKNVAFWNFIKPWLKTITAGLLLIVILVAITNSSFSLVNLEPFDAYIYEAAGIASISIFVVSLVISWFEPMAYCRYGCPTGTLLDYIRRNSQSGNFNRADLALILGILLALSGSFL